MIEPVSFAGNVESGAILQALDSVFQSLGRALICLGPDFRVVHSSAELDRMTGEQVLGRPIEEILGPELFGPEGPLRKALAQGERREGWDASLQLGTGAPLRVSVTVAPITRELRDSCDLPVSYIVVLHATDEGDGSDQPANSERDRVRAALEAHQWRREEAARALGMSRTTLWRKMREHSLLQPAVACNA
jgi:hypothetical protein